MAKEFMVHVAGTRRGRERHKAKTKIYLNKSSAERVARQINNARDPQVFAIWINNHLAY